jgi:hypothetical protein
MSKGETVSIRHRSSTCATTGTRIPQLRAQPGWLDAPYPALFAAVTSLRMSHTITAPTNTT